MLPSHVLRSLPPSFTSLYFPNLHYHPFPSSTLLRPPPSFNSSPSIPLLHSLRRPHTRSLPSPPNQGDDTSPHSLRIELSSENDLFFHYMHVIDEAGFRMLQERQKLMVGFTEYPNVLIRMLNNAIKEPHRCAWVWIV